jgi:Predicted redox protein, regulator of disulfide bond formation
MVAGRTHTYESTITWTGNRGRGTCGYRDYDRDALIEVAGKPSMAASSDPLFRGDRQRHNPEDLLVASLALCHMLWYLHLCAEAGVRVTAYRDQAAGTMVEEADTGGRFSEVTLRPQVTIDGDSDLDMARRLHADAHRKCFIANSVNFPVHHDPCIRFAD